MLEQNFDHPENINFYIKTVVLQPTTFCNLDCKYCYLPDRDKKFRMSPSITKKLADDISSEKRQINLLWHAGEPMAGGLNHFVDLFQPFEGNGLVTNIIQTNAIGINDNWCDFFKKNKFHVGVSIDGPPWANENRKDRRGKDTYDLVIKGIECLKNHNIDFTIIAVVDQTSIERADDLYSFFCDLGCNWVGINIEENESVNTRTICDDERVTNFWKSLYESWYRNPKIEIREISSTLNWFHDVLQDSTFSLSEDAIDLIPSISFDGKIVLLSPELLGGKSAMYHDFITGNIFKDYLFDFEKRTSEFQYVKDFTQGVLECKKKCEYFNFCRGGQASNKFYETGNLNITETSYCRNSKKRLVDAIMDQLNF